MPRSLLITVLGELVLLLAEGTERIYSLHHHRRRSWDRRWVVVLVPARGTAPPAGACRPASRGSASGRSVPTSGLAPGLPGGPRWSADAVAEITGRTAGSVRVVQHRALRRLAAELRPKAVTP